MTDNITVTTQTGPYAIVPIWVLTAGLTGSELATYVSLRSFADRAGEAHPRVRTVASRAGVSERTAERAIARMRELDLVQSTRIYRPDGTIAGCSYVLRDMPPGVTVTPPPGEDVATPPDGDVATPPDGDVATPPTGMTEQELTKELTKELPPPLRGGPPAVAARGTRLPADWRPGPALEAWGRQNKIAWDGDEVDQFRDYWHSVAGAKGVKRDWEATWRVWVRRNRQGGTGRHPRPNGAAQRLTAAQEVAARLEARHARRQIPNDSVRALFGGPA